MIELIAFFLAFIDYILVVLALYLVARLLSWSNDKLLPDIHSRILNILIASVAAAVSTLPVIDVGLTLILPVVKGELATSISSTRLFGTLFFAALIAFSFLTLQLRNQKPHLRIQL